MVHKEVEQLGRSVFGWRHAAQPQVRSYVHAKKVQAVPVPGNACVLLRLCAGGVLPLCAALLEHMLLAMRDAHRRSSDNL